MCKDNIKWFKLTQMFKYSKTKIIQDHGILKIDSELKFTVKILIN